jgi:hypothetical protein
MAARQKLARAYGIAAATQLMLRGDIHLLHNNSHSDSISDVAVTAKIPKNGKLKLFNHPSVSAR